MKRLLLGLLSCSILMGCGRQNYSTIWPDTETVSVQNTSGNQVSIKSDQGLKKFYSFLVADLFEFIDFNNDKGLNYDEFTSYMFFVGNGSFLTIIIGPTHPVQVHSAAPISASTIGDSYQTFLKVDKNKNGKISLKEALANYSFLGVNLKLLREGFAKYIFNKVDINKNKSVSQDEYKSYISYFDPGSQNSLMALFLASDNNFDNKLGFSEFEDLAYAVVQAGSALPIPDPVPTSQPCETCDTP